MSGKPFTPTELDQILRSARLNGYDRRTICDELGIPLFRLNNAISTKLRDEWHEGKKAHDAAQGPDSKASKRFADILAVPPPRYAKEVPATRTKTGRWRHAVIYSDTHFPYQDDPALGVIQGIIKDVRPNLVVHLGDIIDCYSISRYVTDPARLQTLQDDIDATRVHLHQIAQLAPNAEKLLLGGNHEDRLRKIIWNLEGAARELPRLRVFQKAMTWPVLLDLEAIGWEFAEYMKQPVVGRIPKLLLKHGDIVRKWSGFSAKGEWEKHARSGISGHTHRMGSFSHRDLNGSHGWWENGCSCRLDPEYVRQPDWQHSCAVVTYSDDWFNVAPVYIESGRAVWREKEFAA